MVRDDKLSGDTYERWSDGRYSIVRYSHWDGKEGTFFFAYDLGNLSRRINEKPVSSFEEARALIKDWLSRDSEPDLGRMFDMAYEDQCRDACGL